MIQTWPTPLALARSPAPLCHDDIEPTARLLADAFHDNPCYRFMHPRASSWRADLTAFFERDLGFREGLRLTCIVRGARGERLGTGTLQPPGSVLSAGAGQVFFHWVWPTLRQQGLHTLARTWLAEREFSYHQRVAAGRPEYWLVHAVAVRPDQQGCGVGSAVMGWLLDQMRMRTGGAGVPLVLATQREANLKFYARLGFRLRHQATLGRALRQPGFRSWFMRYEPTEPADPARGGTNS